MPGQRTTTERGLGYDHQKTRDRLLRQHVDGAPCWWCGQPMYLTEALAADHSLARAHGGTQADRLLHERCNKSRGDGSRDHLRPALASAPRTWTSREW